MAVVLHNIENFNIGLKASGKEKDTAISARLQRMKERYDQEGLRRTVDAVIVVHQHSHPHVLILQQGSTFKLPGGKCKPGEDEVECLKRKLCSKLSQPDYQVCI